MDIQKKRPIAISTPLGDDVLLVRKMTVTEELGRLTHCVLDLVSEDEQIRMEDVLGKTMTVSLDLPGGKKRYFNGYVSSFGQTGRVGNYAAYAAVLYPWLWYLTRTADCRIFQDKTVPDIIKEIFREHGLTDFEESLSSQYRQWVYCVQYRETDFNFVSRLMEQEGIYYFIKHDKTKHTIVLADSYSAHERIASYEEIPYVPPDELEARQREHIHDWRVEQQIQPGACALDSFDFERPKADLAAKSSMSKQHAHADFEVFDYAGEYVKNTDGDAYARTRIEALHARYERVQGQGNARGLAVGGLFKLIDHPREDQNREYLIVSATHELVSDEYETKPSIGPVPIYSCCFSAIDSKQPYRAPRITPKPFVHGPQTAIVTGKSGEEIWTDKYGRVKVQFHWDRYGKSDENSSCWVRVSHPWAGKNWGMVAIPRMGQEVIVDFLEGDPDQPIITGRVYNGDQMPPYALPANMTQTGTLTRSSKGGSAANCNELRFEDKKGEEQVYLHAEKNQDIEVENDETTLVQHDRTETVGHNETIAVGANRMRTVGQNEIVSIALTRTHNVGVNEMINVGGAQEITIGGLQALTVGLTRVVTVGISQNVNIGTSMDVDVGTNLSETVGNNHSANVGDNRTTSVGKDDSLKVGKNRSADVGENRTTSVGKDDSLKVGKNLTIDAGDQIVIQTGKASITMKKDGTITIQGKDITIEGSGKINAKADSDIVMKGSKILQN